MTQASTISQMYMAIVIEENVEGFHRETLWYGGSPGNLALLIIDAMKDWYEPNIAVLDESIIQYHKMLEDNENVTFDMLSGVGFDADGMKIFVELTNDLSVMFNFIINEICSIFAKNGETPEAFGSLAEFKEHFTKNYEIDENLLSVLDGINEISISRALVLIDMKYNYTYRHFRPAQPSE